MEIELQPVFQENRKRKALHVYTSRKILVVRRIVGPVKLQSLVGVRVRPSFLASQAKDSTSLELSFDSFDK